MEEALKNLLESQVLNDDVKSALTEAWQKKLNEARQELEEQIREEFARRYDHDKSHLVDAMDKFLNEHLTKELQEFNEDRKALREERAALQREIAENKNVFNAKLKERVETLNTFVVSKLEEEVKELREDRKNLLAERKQLRDARKAAKETYQTRIGLLNKFVMEQLKTELAELNEDRKQVMSERVKLTKTVVESRREYKAKLAEHQNKLTNFVLKNLQSELREFMQDKKELAEQRVGLHKQLRESRLAYKKEFAERINKLEKFVLNQLTEEVAEFEQDKALLAERRVQLETESKKRLKETEKAFIAKASRLVESTMLKTMRTELTQLKGDLMEARKNNFGRRIFEAYAAEYMTSYLAEGSEVKKLQKELSEAKVQMESVKSLVENKNKELDATARKLKLAEERAERSKIVNELLAPLPRGQKQVMASLLESVKTDKLNDAFKKFLPSVLNETGRKVEVRKQLVETEAPVVPVTKTVKQIQPTKVAVTGDRKNKLAESVSEEKVETTKSTAEIVELRKLAGLEKKGIKE